MSATAQRASRALEMSTPMNPANLPARKGRFAYQPQMHGVLDDGRGPTRPGELESRVAVTLQEFRSFGPI